MRKSSARRATTSRSARWFSKSWRIRSLESSRSSACIPASSSPAAMYINANKGKRERVGRILRMHANHREEIDEIRAGDIASAVGLKETTHRQYHLRREPPDRARIDGVPGAGYPRRDRAEDQGGSGQDEPCADSVWRKKIRRSRPIPTNRPVRRSSPAWASCIWKSSLTACCANSSVEATVGKPQVAYKECHPQAREGRGTLCPSDRRSWSVRSLRDRDLPARARYRL